MSSKGQDMNGAASPHYGKLMTAQLSNEVRHIWYTRDKELPELPRHRWSFELQSDMEQVEQRELITKLLEAFCFSDREDQVVQMIVMDGLTLREAGKELGVTQERVRQIYLRALRKARARQKSVTGTNVWSIDCEVTTWQHYSWMKQQQRRKDT
jgi:hypothetical protein